MKKSVLLLSVIFLLSTSLFAQTGKLNKDTSAYPKAPLYILKLADGRQAQTGGPVLSLIDHKETIEKMEIVESSEATKLYNEDGKNGAIIITLKKDASLLTATELFENYKIKKRNRKLPLFIDSNLIKNAANNFYSTKKITRVTIAIESETGAKYISIITNNIKFKRDPNTIYIRGNATTAVK